MARHKGLTFYEKKKRFSREIVREIFITIFYCFAAALVAFVIVFAAGMKVTMIGVSMEPTLHNGQEVLINRFVYILKDIASFSVCSLFEYRSATDLILHVEFLPSYFV